MGIRVRNPRRGRFASRSLFPLRTFGIWRSGGKTHKVKAHTANEAAAKAVGGPVVSGGGASPGPWYFTSAGGRGDSIKVWEEFEHSKNPLPGYAPNPRSVLAPEPTDQAVKVASKLISKFSLEDAYRYAKRRQKSKFQPLRGFWNDVADCIDYEIEQQNMARLRGPGSNPDVRLHWTAQYGHKYDPRQRRSVPDLRQRAAWWRTGLKKPKDVRRAVSKAHKYALKQKDWVKHRVTVEKNPRRRNRKPAKRRGRWSKRRPRDAKGRFVKSSRKRRRSRR